MDLTERENNRRNSIVGSIISGVAVDVDIATESSKRGINKKGEKESFKPKSYYLPQRLYKAIGIKSTLDAVDKSQVVRTALTEYLKDILEEYKEVFK